ncbi:MAG: hypothetical protein H9535_03305 [Ignavibacteria bacterium]|nr:hypothetical protein [Ignavibacteria bacterium]
MALFGAFSLAVLGAELLITQTQAFQLNGAMISLAILADVCLGIPLLYWLLVACPRKIDLITIVPVGIASILAARFIIPTAYHGSIVYIEYLAGGLELALLVVGIAKIRHILREYRRLHVLRFDFVQNLRESFALVLNGGRESTALNIIATEISMLCYAFYWRSEEEITEKTRINGHSFSTYKSSGYTAIFFVLLTICAVEAVGAHFLVGMLWNSTAALVLTALSAYTFLFLIADYVAIIKRPIVLEDSHLLIRTGLRWQAEIPLDVLASVRLAPKRLDENTALTMKRISPFGAPNVLIEFSTRQEIRGLYGMKTSSELIGCTIDHAEKFVELLQEKIGNCASNYTQRSAEKGINLKPDPDSCIFQQNTITPSIVSHYDNN